MNTSDMTSFIVPDIQSTPVAPPPPPVKSQPQDGEPPAPLPPSYRRRSGRSNVNAAALAAAAAAGEGEDKMSLDYKLMRARNNLAVRRCRARSRFLRIKLCEELRGLRSENTMLERQLREARRHAMEAERQCEYLRKLLREQSGVDEQEREEMEAKAKEEPVAPAPQHDEPTDDEPN